MGHPAIQFMMEQQGLTRKDLEPMIGSRARVSEVMTGKRGLTLAMVRRVRSGLGISADLLVGRGRPCRRVGGGVSGGHAAEGGDPEWASIPREASCAVCFEAWR